VSNLLSNAVRLAPEGTAITVAAGSRQGWAWVAVRDEGPGIADEDRDRIFERFHRGSGQLSQGSGLGLTIARQIVESHQGRLVLAQRSGPGSTFAIWLPERAVAGAPERSLEPPDCDPLGPIRGGNAGALGVYWWCTLSQGVPRLSNPFLLWSSCSANAARVGVG
jgi:hypothetical protein